MIRLTIVFLCLLTVAAMGQEEAVIKRLLETPPAQLNQVLTDERNALSDSLLDRLLQTSLEEATAGRLPAARQRAELADAIDFFRRDQSVYRGVAQARLGRKLIELSRMDEALQVAEALVASHPEAYNGHMLLGIVGFERREPARAEAALREAIRLRPRAEEAYHMLAMTLLIKGDETAALAAFHDVLKINPQNGFAKDAIARLSGQSGSDPLPPPGPAREAFERAEQLFAKRQFREAIAAYEEVLRTAPTYSKALVYIGDAYFAQGELNRALDCYQKAVAINPKDRQAHRFMGDTYEKMYDETGDVALLDKAIESYRKALEADPSYETARENLREAMKKRAGR